MLYDIFVINPKSNIAVATLWSKKEYILSNIPENVKKKINIIGTVYTSYGINFVLETLGKNPQIDTLILFGSDLSTSGEDLKKLFGEKKIESLKILFNKEQIEEIINTVKLIDLREDFKNKDFSALIKAIEENYNPKRPVREKIILKIEEKSEMVSWKIPLSGLYIYETSVFRAWLKILDAIMRFGYVKPSEYEELQKEYLNIMVTIGLYGKEYKLEEEFLEFLRKEDFEKHLEEVLLLKKPEGVSYTYGERLFNHRLAGNQIEYLINKLVKVPYTRRAISITWDFEIDKNSKEPPCILLIQGEISGNYYNHTVYIRSNDMYSAWPLNTYAQIKLAEKIVEEINKRANTNLEIGTITIISSSAHIYKHDWENARRVLEKYGRRIFDFIEDPKGNYVIYHNEDKIVIEHRTPDNLSLVEKIETKNFWEAYTWLKNETRYSTYQHAVYIGKELARAFEKLRRGETYIQDEA